jgi:sulfopropanediol 3-dehydrogenase
MLKEGGHRLFENDPETATVVSEMVIDLEKSGLDAMRKYSRQFDGWDPPDFQLNETQIREAIEKLDAQVIQDTGRE